MTLHGWIQVSITLPDALASNLAEALLQIGALGAQVQDAETRSWLKTKDTQPHLSTVIASFEDDADQNEQVRLEVDTLIGSMALSESPTVLWEHVAHQDFVQNFYASWPSLQLADRVWIVPSWEEAHFRPTHPNDLIIRLDPGVAFGTGHHETTRLCAKAILDAVQSDPSPAKLTILDVGTGTGILAFIALLSGAGRAVGTEIDPPSLVAAQMSAEKNGLADRFEASDKAPNQLGEQFDIVVANILARPLIDMAHAIAGALKKPNGRLLLSGLLREQVTEVVNAYEQQGLRFLGETFLNDWSLLAFRTE